MKKLIPAIVMLLVSAVVLSTASYAWFTTSKSADASGMNVTAEAPTSILIRGQYTADSQSVWSEFTSYVDFGTLRPTENRIFAASSLNGKDFFAPANCEDTTGAMKFNSAIETVGSEGYVDYVVQLQNTSAANDVNITVESITLGSLPIADAIRVAIIVKGGNEDGTDKYYTYNPKPAADGEQEWVAILGADGVAIEDTYAKGPLSATSSAVTIPDADTDATGYENAIKAIVANAQGTDPTYSTIGAGTAGTNICTLNALTYDEAGVATDDNIQEIVIRVWIEGQDSACQTGNAGQGTTVKVQFGIHSTTPVAND